MRDISKCYEKCNSQKSSFTLSKLTRRIYFSKENNLCFYNSNEDIDIRSVSLYCFKRIKNEKD